MKEWTDLHTHVMRLLVEGKGIKEIAGHFNLTYWTINNYVRDVYEKCGIKTTCRRVGLVHYYLRNCSAEERDRIINGGRAG